MLSEAALQSLREIMGKLKLTVNEEKTRICEVPEGEFDFLGYTFGRMFSARTGQARIGYRPSKKSIQRVVCPIKASGFPTDYGPDRARRAQRGRTARRRHSNHSRPARAS